MGLSLFGNITPKPNSKKYLLSNIYRLPNEIAAINMSKSQEKKSNFSKIFSTKLPFKKKYRFSRKYKVYFQILEVVPVILTTYLPV